MLRLLKRLFRIPYSMFQTRATTPPPPTHKNCVSRSPSPRKPGVPLPESETNPLHSWQRPLLRGPLRPCCGRAPPRGCSAACGPPLGPCVGEKISGNHRRNLPHVIDGTRWKTIRYSLSKTESPTLETGLCGDTSAIHTGRDVFLGPAERKNNR